MCVTVNIKTVIL